MSNTATRLCRALPMSPAQKAVLMCIADRANEAGVAWPSLPGICEWTCLKRTAVIEAMKWLEANKLMVVTRAEGKNNSCALALAELAALQPDDPSATRTGTPDEPVRETDSHPSAKRTPPVRETDYTRPADGPEASISITEAPIKHQKKKRAKAASTSLPENFEVSESVAAWSAKKGFDADAMNAIRGDWGNVRANAAKGGASSGPSGTSFARGRQSIADTWRDRT